MSNYVNLKLYEHPVKAFSDKTVETIKTLQSGSNVNDLKEVNKDAYNELHGYVECQELKAQIFNRIEKEGHCRILFEFNGNGITYRSTLNWLAWLNEGDRKVGLQMTPGDHLQSFYFEEE